MMVSFQSPTTATTSHDADPRPPVLVLHVPSSRARPAGYSDKAAKQPGDASTRKTVAGERSEGSDADDGDDQKGDAAQPDAREQGQDGDEEGAGEGELDPDAIAEQQQGDDHLQPQQARLRRLVLVTWQSCLLP
jgi:hypothetical protein